MAFLIGGANSAAADAAIITNSCRFNDGDSAYMLKEAGAGSRRTFTFNTWVKLGNLGIARYLFTSWNANNDAGFTYLSLTDADKIKFAGYSTTYLETTQVLRDPTAWYMLTLAVDTTSGTADNRCRIYLNGTEITTFGTRNNPDQNDDLAFNQDGVDLVLASNDYGGSKGNYHDGYLAETVWIDGTQYAASNFGESNSDSPNIWQPVDVSGLTFGTNGFYLDYEDSANLGNDANGGTDLTETNLAATDQTTDTPVNNFCTLNPLDGGVVNTSLEEGNCKINSTGDSSWGYWASTFHLSTGKWYWEVKMITGSAAWFLGVVESENLKWFHKADVYPASSNGGHAIYKDGTKRPGTGSDAAYMAAYVGDDIISIALDLDNNKVYFAKNGQWADGSGNNDEASPNAFLDLTADLTASNPSSWKAIFNMDDNCDCEVNFGNPPYANSSDAADEDGYGAFEYAPPSGYFSLCTKNLAEYG